MVATVTVRQAYQGTDGSPLESSDITGTSTRLQTKDQYAPTDETYPVPIPSSGLNYSYWIHVYLKIDGGTFTKINSIRHSCTTCSWTFGSGGQLYRGNRDTGDKGCPMDTEYDVAHGVGGGHGEGISGDAIDDVTNGHGYYNTQTTKTANLSGETDAVIDSSDHSGTGKCKAIVEQVKVDTVANGASPGTQTDVTCTWKYNEM